ncbi:MAG: hypothetical protein AAF721_19185 [Myxococcota bacterium]
MTLVIKGEEEVLLRGYIDSKGNLQFRYGDNIELFPHGDSIEVTDVTKLRVVLQDPEGTDLTAAHDEGSGRIEWASVPNGVDHTFLPNMTEPVQVTVSPPKMIYVTATPTGGLPDS